MWGVIENVIVRRRSKQMYELIYNRIISNLLLWTPSAPGTTQQPQSEQSDESNIDASNPFFSANMTDSASMPFSMAKSNIFIGELDALLTP